MSKIAILNLIVLRFSSLYTGNKKYKMEWILILVFTVLSLQYISCQQTQYEAGQYYTIGMVHTIYICFTTKPQQIQLKGRALLFTLLILLDYFLGLLSLLWKIMYQTQVFGHTETV